MNWKNAGYGGIGALLMTAFLGWGLTRDPAEIPSPLPGKEAPRFALDRLDGGPKVDLAALRGDIVVLNFWASWCLNCRYEHAVLSQIANRYDGRGVYFFGAVYNDSPGNATRWIEEMGGQSYPSLIDPGSQAAIDYGLYGVPETFFIGPDGKVAYKHIGPVTEEILVEWIDKLLVQKEVAAQ
ncbi:MAG TPA: redoxin domain-containing protein [Longimicrobiales bacterium]|nr:redoxin domain-containing protein [Longimicrobiales bacterium]